jgi:hypothetical protein
MSETQGPSEGKPFDPETYNHETHIRCDDGLVYERRISQAVGVAAGMHVQGEEKSALNKRLEAAMTKAVEDAIAEGVNDADEVRSRIHDARDRTLAQQLAEDISSGKVGINATVA